jgi:hypothetical protein
MRTADVAPDRHGSSSRTSCSDSLRTALRLDLRLHWSYLFWILVLGVICLYSAVAHGTRWAIGPILCAAAVPGALGSDDPDSIHELRAALGISRAAAVRSRTRMVCVLQGLLAAVAAVAIFAGDDPDGPGVMHRIVHAGGMQVMAPTIHYWADLLIWLTALIASHLLYGCVAMRAGTTFALVGCVATYLWVYVAIELIDFLANMAAIVIGTQHTLGQALGDTGEATLSVVVRGVIAVVVLVLFVRRRRTWIREA